MNTQAASRVVGQGLAVALLAGVAAGCEYTLEPLHSTEYKTVAVSIFTRSRDVFRRELEMRLTNALVKQIELKTRYKVVSRSRADTMLTGSIDSVVQRPLSWNPDTGRPRELELTIFVSFEWKDLPEGNPIKSVSNFSVAGPYITHEPFSRDFFQGSEDVINKLARRIVEQLEEPWPS
ncbi:MAG: LptE family protein [Planctomycetota bacterium]|jgi:hypothetical protein